MTDDAPPSEGEPVPPSLPPRTPGSRVSAGFVIAIVVAVLMLLGIIGLVAAALLSDDSEPSGTGLGQQIDVDARAIAPPGDEPDDHRVAPPGGR